jgi:hypothetical protein
VSYEWFRASRGSPPQEPDRDEPSGHMLRDVSVHGASMNRVPPRENHRPTIALQVFRGPSIYP